MRNLTLPALIVLDHGPLTLVTERDPSGRYAPAAGRYHIYDHRVPSAPPVCASSASEALCVLRARGGAEVSCG